MLWIYNINTLLVEDVNLKVVLEVVEFLHRALLDVLGILQRNDVLEAEILAGVQILPMLGLAIQLLHGVVAVHIPLASIMVVMNLMP